MRMYESGTPRVDQYQMLENSLCSHRLFSMHGSYERSVQNWLEHPKNGILANLDKPRPKAILLDSGGFSAWKSNMPTDVKSVIRAYSNFIKIAKPHFEEIWAISLDSIPGEFGRDPTPEEIKESIRKSDENFHILTDTFGPCILPVFHQGEDLERGLEVECQVSGKSDYMCVSPRNDLPEGKRREWAELVHSKLKRTTRTHGLATTGNNMVKRVPFYSVDSATWILASVMGGMVYYWEEGMRKRYTTIAMSNDGGRDRFQGAHFDSYAKPFQDAIVARIESLGFTLDQVKKDVRPRSLCSMLSLEMFMNSLTEKDVTRSHQATLFGV